MAQWTIYVNDDLYERLEEYDTQADESVSQMARRAIRRELREKEDIRDRLNDVENSTEELENQVERIDELETQIAEIRRFFDQPATKRILKLAGIVSGPPDEESMQDARSKMQQMTENE